MLERWMAYYELEPWGDHWRQAGRIAAAVWTAMRLVAAEQGVKLPVMEVDDFIPRRADPDELLVGSGERRLSPEEQEREMCRLFGGGPS